MKLAAVALALSATAAHADYSNHPATQTFTQAPCTEAIAAIDQNPEADTLEATTANIARQGMIWGFLLGYDTAKGGLQGSEETTLTRLRKACAASPETPARDLLDAFN